MFVFLFNYHYICPFVHYWCSITRGHSYLIVLCVLFNQNEIFLFCLLPNFVFVFVFATFVIPIVHMLLGNFYFHLARSQNVVAPASCSGTDWCSIYLFIYIGILSSDAYAFPLSAKLQLEDLLLKSIGYLLCRR